MGLMGLSDFPGKVTQQEEQRVAIVDPGTHISFLFTRCWPTRPHYAATITGAAAAAAAAECCYIRQFVN